MKELIVIVGGGAAGFFTAINIAQKKIHAHVIILEKSEVLLHKVKISGGGRCNVTHSCFEPMQLIKNYPRGEKSLINIFHQFQPKDTIEWFEQRGVSIKRESDGRMFPSTNDSQTIIDCFLREAKKNKIQIMTNCGVDQMKLTDKNQWLITTNTQEKFLADQVVLCTGSHLRTWKLIETIGHTIENPVPSLFTFNTKDARLKDLMGVSIPLAKLQISDSKLKSEGPLLITHWGLSGPAILKLSAWGARDLAAKQYKFNLEINWTGLSNAEEVKEIVLSTKNAHPKKQFSNTILFHLPSRLWDSLIQYSRIDISKKWADISSKEIQLLVDLFYKSTIQVTGKSTNKDEFVTCGGVNLKEIDFKTMQSKKYPNLYFAGEVIDVDAITGGFNFQAAWSTSWIVSEHI
jgi:predicted Rossmann fold flavoprotein